MLSNVYIIGGGNDYRDMFLNLGFALVSELLDADIVCFTGGSDVSPVLYGEAKHPHTYSAPLRDEEEKKIFLYCVEKDIPMVGICRGGQFLNVMNGGKMYQHVQGHTQYHHLIDRFTGETVYASSTHHQMMRPAENGIIIATAKQGGFKEYMEDGNVVRVTDDLIDVEVVFYPHTSCLCFQPHPEFPNMSNLASYFKSLLTRYIPVKV